MYLVELRPGKEELYRTVDELAIAVRSGAVDTHSRIFHRATSKWISITVHPQYKAIAAELTPWPPAVEKKRSWPFLQTAVAGLAAENKAEATIPPGNGARGLPWWRRPLGLGLAGVLLLLGVQLAFTIRPPWAGPRARPVAIRPTGLAQPGRSETASTVTRSAASGYSNVGYPLPNEAAAAEPAPPARSLPRAPRVKAKALAAALNGSTDARAETGAMTPERLLQRYEAAYDSAAAQLDAGFRVARLEQLFAPARLTPSGGVRETRMGLAGAANVVRGYRKGEAAIEQAYQDSFAVFSRQLKWSPAQGHIWTARTPRRERPELAALTGSLLSEIDSVLEVLDAQAGAYRTTGDRITFENAGAARVYGALRRRIEGQLSSPAATKGGVGASRALLEAIGTSRLPRES